MPNAPTPPTRPWHTLSLRLKGGHELHFLSSDPALRDQLARTLDATFTREESETVILGDAFPVDGATAYPEDLMLLVDDMHAQLATAPDDESDTCDCPACQQRRRTTRIH